MIASSFTRPMLIMRKVFSSSFAIGAEFGDVGTLGAKWLLLDGNLAFRTAIYHAVKNWERNTDLESTSTILTKKRQSNGIEFELAGRLTDNWEVFSGLSLIDGKILEVAPVNGNPNFVVQVPRNTPRQTFNLWSTYQLPMGFKVGGGMDYKSERYGAAPTGTAPFNPNWAPSYVRWDAMVAYEQPKYADALPISMPGVASKASSSQLRCSSASTHEMAPSLASSSFHAYRRTR